MFAAFESLDSAVGAAVESQHALIEESWPDERDVRVRMGVHVGEPHRRAVAVGDDHGLEFVGRLQLVVGVDRRGPRGPVEAAFGLVRIGVADRDADVAAGAGCAGRRAAGAADGSGHGLGGGGGGLANILSKNVPGLQATAEVTGGSVDNLKLLGTGKSEVGFTMADSGRPPSPARSTNAWRVSSSTSRSAVKGVSGATISSGFSTCICGHATNL